MKRLAEQLRSVIVATDEYRRAMASAFGVGVHEAAVLGELLHEGPLPPSALVKRLGIASASVTALLDRLEAAGYTRRERHPTDRRSVLVVLTPGGRAAINAGSHCSKRTCTNRSHAPSPLTSASSPWCSPGSLRRCA